MIKANVEQLLCASNCLVNRRETCHTFYSYFNTWKLRHRENILTYVPEL